MRKSGAHNRSGRDGVHEFKRGELARAKEAGIISRAEAKGETRECIGEDKVDGKVGGSLRHEVEPGSFFGFGGSECKQRGVAVWW